MEFAQPPAATAAAARPSSSIGSASSQLIWFVAGAGLAFLVPYLGTSVLDLNHDVYLLFYVVFVFMLLATYARANELDVRGLFSRNLIAGSLIGLALLAPLIFNVLSEDSTARPGGAYFVFELFWRGGVYGVTDALLLTVFPCVIVLSALGGKLPGWRRKLSYGVASLALIMIITATYHLGYSQFREDGIKGPETGNVLISLPMLLTTNPVGSMIDHAGMHIAAVSHEYETGLRLPPQTDVED